MNIIEFHNQAKAQASRRWIMGYRTLVLTKNTVKVRLSISDNFYIDLYFNQRYSTTNYALILNDERIYGRDCYDANWHLHPYEDPSKHDTPKKGRRSSV